MKRPFDSEQQEHDKHTAESSEGYKKQRIVKVAKQVFTKAATSDSLQAPGLFLPSQQSLRRSPKPCDDLHALHPADNNVLNTSNQKAAGHDQLGDSKLRYLKELEELSDVLGALSF